MKTQTQIENVYTIIKASQHRDLKKVEKHGFPHVKTDQITPINMHEFSAAGTCFPLFFIKNSTSGQLFPVALFGLIKNENLFYSDEGWLASYVPLNMKTWPFLLTIEDKSADKPHWQVAVKSQSQYLSKVDGEPLFINGEPSSLLKQITEELTVDMQQKAATAKFIDFLIQQKLIKEIKFELGFTHGEKQIVDGIYAINEDTLQNLDAKTVQEMYQLGYFQPIYSMLGSQHNLYELIKRSKAKRDNTSVMSLNIISE